MFRALLNVSNHWFPLGTDKMLSEIITPHLLIDHDRNSFNRCRTIIGNCLPDSIKPISDISSNGKPSKFSSIAIHLVIAFAGVVPSTEDTQDKNGSRWNEPYQISIQHDYWQMIDSIRRFVCVVPADRNFEYLLEEQSTIVPVDCKSINHRCNGLTLGTRLHLWRVNRRFLASSGKICRRQSCLTTTEVSRPPVVDGCRARWSYKMIDWFQGETDAEIQ